MMQEQAIKCRRHAAETARDNATQNSFRRAQDNWSLMAEEIGKAIEFTDVTGQKLSDQEGAELGPVENWSVRPGLETVTTNSSPSSRLRFHNPGILPLAQPWQRTFCTPCLVPNPSLLPRPLSKTLTGGQGVHVPVNNINSA